MQYIVLSTLSTKISYFHRCKEEMVERLKQTEKNTVERDGIKATRLCTHREDVNHINQEHLKKLAGILILTCL